MSSATPPFGASTAKGVSFRASTVAGASFAANRTGRSRSSRRDFKVKRERRCGIRGSGRRIWPPSGRPSGWSTPPRTKAGPLPAAPRHHDVDLNTVGRGHISVPSARVSIFGGIQPDKLTAYLEQAAHALANDGLLQRFQVMVFPDPRRWEFGHAHVPRDSQQRGATVPICPQDEAGGHSSSIRPNATDRCISGEWKAATPTIRRPNPAIPMFAQ
jgi:hypothetical protein